MPLSLDLYRGEILVLLLVFARIAAMIMVAPMFGAGVVSWRLRGAVAVALVALVAPAELARTTRLPDALPDYLVMLGAELLIGLILGLGVVALFAATHLAGQLISQMSGMQLAEAFDPTFDTSVPVFSQLLSLVTLAVFLSIGGHRRVVEALLDTYVWLPPGQGEFSESFTAAMTSVLAQSFVLGIRAAAPTLVALLLATLILGLASRALPQLNLVALGFAPNIIVTLLVLGMSLGAATWIFQDQLDPILETIVESLHPQR